MRDFVYSLLLFITIGIIPQGNSRAQAVPDHFANNITSIKWVETQTPHFKIVFPDDKGSLAKKVLSRVEQIYEEYRARLGTAPSRKITIYLKSASELVSDIGARKIDEEYSIWKGDPTETRLVLENMSLLEILRTEIACAFQENIQYFPVDYYYYLFSRPSQSSWSDGFASYMARPPSSLYDSNTLQKYRLQQDEEQMKKPSTVNRMNILLGRSQMYYYEYLFPADSIDAIYSYRQSLLGLVSYFDFNSAFEQASGVSYDAFTERWSQEMVTHADDKNEEVPRDSLLTHAGRLDTSDMSLPAISVQPYHSFSNIQWETPFAIPYYINSSDFGLAAYVSLAEPLRTHRFRYYGSVSFADPLHKSFFYSKYVNNSFRPEIELSFNHFPSASGFFGKSRKTKTTDVIALTSLWKLTGLSHGNSAWYAGVTLRHLAFDYFPASSFQLHHPDLYLENTKTRQTDLKTIITWRNLKPGRHTLIHPRDGEGLRFSGTVSDKVLGSQTRYARLSLDGYTIFPGFGDQRFYLYANGVIDLGEPAGRDYLSFSDNGDYHLPGADFTGSINPGYDRFVRGYTEPLLGDRFLFGRLEYRIPFQFDTRKKLLGFIPPARTSFTLFADGGVMGDARITPDRTALRYRYSVGTELKRVFSIGGSFQLTYELGLAQPLNKSFGPQPYFNVTTGIPF